MKKLVLVLPFLLAGCFAGIKYDNLELYSVSKVRVAAENFSCQKIEAAWMEEQARLFKHFSEHSSGGETFELATELHSLTDELKKRFDKGVPSPVYCELKAKNIRLAAERISATVGDKLR